MGGKMSRDKGANFECRIANELKPWFKDAKRHLEYQVDEAFGVDIDNTHPFSFQLKRFKGSVPMSKINEIQTDRDKHYHVLVAKSDREPIMVTMFWDDWLHMLNAYMRETYDL